MVEASIPRHITGIYVFAVVNLLALLCISGVDADVIVKRIKENSSEIVGEYEDLAAGFGPNFPQTGLEGRVVYAVPKEACSPVNPPPHLNGTDYRWILLIARGGSCQFADKVLTAESSGYAAAIIHNVNWNESLQPMLPGKNGSRVGIPSTFVGYTTGMKLKYDYNYTHPEYIIKITEDDGPDIRMYLWPFAIVVAVCFLMVMIFLLVKFVRDHATRRVSRLSKKHLRKIPVRKFKKGDYYDTCAICLDEYEEGEKIRVLPCDHVYHTKCIDPWLTKNKKTCPVCKRRVIPGKDADSESGSDSDEGGSQSGTENTPLLSGSTQRPSSYTSRTRGSLTVVGNENSSTTPQTENEAPEGIGTAVLTTLDEYGAIMPSDTEVEQGAVGGVGISDRYHRQQVHSTAAPVSSRGNIQGEDGEVKETQRDRKRKRNDRERKRRQEEEAAHPESESAAPITETREERRERRKKKKEQKMKEERSTRSRTAGETSQTKPVGEESSGGAVGTEDKGSEAAATSSAVIASDEIRKGEAKKEEGYVNASYSESPEVTLPQAGSRREMNELV